MDKTLIEGLKSNPVKLCVLSTVSTDNKPESAVVGFCACDDGRIIVSTDSTTRKWINAKKNPHVSLVVGWELDHAFFQVDGVVELIAPGHKEYHKTDHIFFEAMPMAKAFKNEKTGFMIITPTWFRKCDYSVQPPEKIEQQI